MISNVTKAGLSNPCCFSQPIICLKGAFWDYKLELDGYRAIAFMYVIFGGDAQRSFVTGANVLFA